MLFFLAFIVALSITAALIPVLARWAPAIGLTDRPGPRKLHTQPVPRVGGIAMALGILAPAMLLVAQTQSLHGLLAGILVLLVFGVWDDRADLHYRVKFLGQMLAVGLCIAISGVQIQTYAADGHPLLPQALSVALTFFFLIGVTNAVNLSDGLDGLAGGMALLCFCAIALLAASGGNAQLTAIACIEGGALLGFLRFNTHPARVFMGDGGSQVLGFTIGVLAIFATQSDISATSAALPLLLVGMPIIDTLMVMLHRFRQGRSPFTSDRNHLHHRLLELGFRHGEAVILLYLSQVTLFLLAYFLRFASDLLIIAVFCAYAAAVLGLLRWATRSGWRVHPETESRSPPLGLERLQRTLRRAPGLALWVMGASMFAYAATVIMESGRVGGDVTVLCLVLLVPLLVSALARAQGAVGWVERTAAYVSVMLLVYLDETAAHTSHSFFGTSWTLLGITGVAALARFWLSPERRFQLTTLDVLVVFIALVIPHLGPVQLPAELTAGIAKAVILLYVVEMLLALDIRGRIPRTCLVLMLAAIAARGLLSLNA
ncbi:MAG TPA: MraY family glycosyltransferase [Steroidobacteraceae bacterium]|nr:MraY family glycosyltransferase [Steroidobacteraceae bacterium]